ncbi:PTS sugar transporter subunit IIA [Mollicutes bacterium LVI A0039]|nr:PTS sugar transporter subunit IIA [Mollicutes bacterium LVI A0039]
MHKYFMFEDFQTKVELIETVGKFLRKKDIVNETFISALAEREEAFPTGLETAQFVENGVNTAIPHAEIEHCKGDALMFVYNKTAIPWKDMVFKKELDVNFFVFIISASGGSHMLFLPQIIDVLKNVEFQSKLILINSTEELEQLVNEKFGG